MNHSTIGAVGEDAAEQERSDKSEPFAGPRKRIVMISGFRIFPTNTGGHVHSGGIARALARLGHDVLVYSLAGRRPDYFAANDGPQERHGSYMIERIEDGLVEETNLGLGFGVLQTAGQRLGLPRIGQYLLLKRGLIPGRLKQALRTTDIVLCDLPFCPPIPGPWSNKPWIMISHNLEHKLLQQGSAREQKFAAWMKTIETAAPEAYDDIFTCADEDTAFFREHDRGGRLKLPIIRCGVDPLAYQVPDGTREKIRSELGLTDEDRLIVFSGSKFGPNLEALHRLREFCRDEREFLQRERIYILVLGSIVTDPERDGALIATGRVASVAPYFAAADAGLNPILTGSGANVKLFEYLATRLPVISTGFGVRGTELAGDVDYLPFEPPHLKSALERFVGERTREEWREHASRVWIQHRRSCDIQELVRMATEQLPAFTVS